MRASNRDSTSCVQITTSWKHRQEQMGGEWSPRDIQACSHLCDLGQLLGFSALPFYHLESEHKNTLSPGLV